MIRPFRGRRAAAPYLTFFAPRFRSALAFLAMLCCLGCAARSPAPPAFTSFIPPAQARIIPDVPFYPQDDRLCGPAALTSVLNAAGDPVSEAEVAAAVYRPDMRGSLSLDLVLYARQRGHPARFFAGTPADIVDAVDRGRPLVVQIDQGLGPVGYDHFMVVVGYAPQGVVVHSGMEREAVMPWRRFFDQWRRADAWTLEVGPRP